MGKMKCDIRIGTSGWHYAHWGGRFYPEELAKSRWFEHYAGHFNTVEINNTFYQLPREVSVKRWHTQAPADFVYTVKASRYITHIKRLKEAGEPLETFFKRMNLLKGKLGLVLYQLPPSLHQDLNLLRDFVKLLPNKPNSVFEFRHKSWYCEDIFRFLDKSGCSFCVHDMAGVETPKVVTGGIVYIRLHGPTGRYAGNYSKVSLRNWAGWIKDNIENVRGVYVYFNNDTNAYAVKNAKMLKEQLCLSGIL